MEEKNWRHSALVRVTHWLTVVAFVALLVSGAEIVISHPRFYWGETGNVNMQPWINLHIPSSRESVPTGYGYTMPDQNGWSRALHFQSAWLLVLTALAYGIASAKNGHFWRDIFPVRGKRSFRAMWDVVKRSLKRKTADGEDAHEYNAMQRVTYTVVIFVLFPLIIWTGLAMSPSFDAAFPFFVNVLGGRQTARTLHFLDTILLVVFLVVHVWMVYLAGFRKRVWAMIAGGESVRDEKVVASAGSVSEVQG